MIEVLEYLDASGHSPYAEWFDRLNAPAAAKVATAVTRLAQGNLSNLKGVGGGVFECKINFGLGYRVYLGKDGERLVILLGGGTKSGNKGISMRLFRDGRTTRKERVNKERQAKRCH